MNLGADAACCLMKWSDDDRERETEREKRGGGGESDDAHDFPALMSKGKKRVGRTWIYI